MIAFYKTDSRIVNVAQLYRVSDDRLAPDNALNHHTNLLLRDLTTLDTEFDRIQYRRGLYERDDEVVGTVSPMALDAE